MPNQSREKVRDQVSVPVSVSKKNRANSISTRCRRSEARQPELCADSGHVASLRSFSCLAVWPHQTSSSKADFAVCVRTFEQ